ncbi:MAG TPA: ABC transporter substrate-binding protein [Actinomycetota bacterium]|nr:ABC transporter substrate-binding protein [Actinomycetota bacterium]
MHAPLDAARALDGFGQASLDVEFLDPVGREGRLERIRTGRADLALMELASFVDAVAEDRSFGGRCVLVLARHIPMAALFVNDRPAGGAPIRKPPDLLRARYGGPEPSTFVAEHRALIARLGGERPGSHVDLPYDALPSALRDGVIDVVPDYAALAERYRRAVGDAGDIGIVRYRDCGVDGYGVGFVASEAALRDRGGEIARFLEVASHFYRRMHRDRRSIIEDASRSAPAGDPILAAREWMDEWERSIFGHGLDLGPGDGQGWSETAVWRREVRGHGRCPDAHELFARLDTTSV